MPAVTAVAEATVAVGVVRAPELMFPKSTRVGVVALTPILG